MREEDKNLEEQKMQQYPLAQAEESSAAQNDAWHQAAVRVGFTVEVIDNGHNSTTKSNRGGISWGREFSRADSDNRPRPENFAGRRRRGTVRDVCLSQAGVR